MPANFGRWGSHTLFDADPPSHHCVEALLNPPLTNLGPLRCVLDGGCYSGATSVAEAITGIALPHDGKNVGTEQRSGGLIEEKHKEPAADLVIVEITAPDYPDLTIIDDPGPLLKKSYVVILAVVPLTDDFYWSIERMQESDPQGKRTICVLTKPDGIDNSAIATISSLAAAAFPLGCAMVLGRPQWEIDESFPIADAKDRAVAFFKTHPELVAITNGVAKEIHKAISSTSATLAALGPDRNKGVDEMRASVAKVWGAITDILSDASKDRYTHPIFKNRELWLAAHIDAHAATFEAAVNTTKPDFRASDFIDDLVASGIESRGSQIPGFFNKPLFDYRAARFVELWTDGAVSLCESVRLPVVAVARTVLQEFASHVPRFVDHVLPLLDDVAQRLADEGKQRTNASFESERRPFSRNRLFTDAVKRIPREKTSKKATETLAGSTKQIISKALDDMRDVYKNEVEEDMSTFLDSYGNRPFNSYYELCLIFSFSSIDRYS
ncbi:hypothetical protein BDK51DRAFT_32062 [Blyttiomyces helicus]|uniref:Dynamin GTPase domain-containing protein n=1 Tax=Blyttiomyces helicus TaxID=388810 RepID=A0A4P9W4T3_9FUNG|nr:hypothetical protein BDK51DRAFT_32062 [Blyttiomyces helicus]|eukprot:RKO85888.1 hypothetical protein BDK51DRAFT_32062 [Blyttiomyces helicus]